MKKAAVLLLLILVTLAFVELGFRVKDYKPFEKEAVQISMTPDWMYIPDSSLAISLKPGVYDIKELEEYQYKATINQAGFRINPRLDSLANDSMHQIIFLGAGSTFGQGLSDDEAYIYVLQKLLPQYKIRNQAVMGYGVANNYRQLVNLKNYKKGDLVIYIYHADQDNRYNLTNQKRALNFFAGNKNFENFQYLSIDDDLSTHVHKFDYHLWPLSQYSAAVNYWEDFSNKKADSKINSNAIARKAILDMNKRCNEAGLNFWLVCWKNEDLSLKTLDYLSSQGVHTFHIPVVIGFDHIPKSQIAHTNSVFADSLANNIRQKYNP
jgi:hypothetical protein